MLKMPTFRIRPSENGVLLDIINPDDQFDIVTLIKGGVDEACYEIMETYSELHEADAPRNFRDWAGLLAFYEDHKWLGDEDWDDEEDVDSDDEDYWEDL